MEKEETMKAYFASIITPIVQQSVETAFRAFSQHGNQKNENCDVFLTIQQVSEFTHIPVNTLYSYSSKGLIPVIKTGKTLLFRKDLIIIWLNEKLKKPISERINEGNKFLASGKKLQTVN